MKIADILDRSLMKLEEQTGSVVKKAEIALNQKNVESDIELKYCQKNLKFHGFIEPSPSKAQVLKKLKVNLENNKCPLLITDYASPNLIEFLVSKEINFLDTAGNAYIRIGGLFILLKGNKKPEYIERQKPKRIFQETGLKILYVLLNNPDLVNESYRTLAKMSNTSPSSVKYVFEELKEMRFLIFPSKNKRKLVYLPKLLERWSIAYEENLKPTLHRGFFRLKNEIPKQRLKQIPSLFDQTYWGGELAAELSTNYLRAEKLILYSSERFSKLMQELVLIPSDKKELEITDIFWNKNLKSFGDNANLASPILIYADLYNSLYERNLETAEIILQNDLSYLF